VYEEVIIRDFMNAWFFEKYDKLSKEDFETVYAEYIDAAELYATEEFDIISSIHYLNTRINAVKLWISLQRQYIAYFGEPYEAGFKFLSKYGYSVEWENDIDKFEASLKRIELRETKKQFELETKTKALLTLRKNKNHEEETPKQTREQFIRLLNTLGKLGYKIEKDSTTVEEFALMLKQQFEEQQKIDLDAGRW